MKPVILLAAFLWWLAIGAISRASSAIYEPLAIPKAENITAFTNALPPSTGRQQRATREPILRFLRKGRNNLAVGSRYPLEHPRRGELEHCEGVMVDRRGQFIFWRLCTRKVLKLETPDGRYALVQLP